MGTQIFPTVVAAWRRAWAHVISLFVFPPAVRRMIYERLTAGEHKVHDPG